MSETTSQAARPTIAQVLRDAKTSWRRLKKDQPDVAKSLGTAMMLGGVALLVTLAGEPALGIGIAGFGYAFALNGLMIRQRMKLDDLEARMSDLEKGVA